MPYIKRDENNQVVALYADPPFEDAEFLASTNDDVMAFLNSNPTDKHSMQFLNSSDYELVRVLEDLIELLVDKNIILFTELPSVAQQKLVRRRGVRQNLAGSSEIMIDENDIL